MVTQTVIELLLPAIDGTRLETMQAAELVARRASLPLLKYREVYDPKAWLAAEEKMRAKKLKRLHQNATALGYKLITAS